MFNKIYPFGVSNKNLLYFNDKEQYDINKSLHIGKIKYPETEDAKRNE